jgi:hypothetical protein
MTGTTHIIISAAISRLGKFDNSTKLALAFGSHFLLDAIPHYGLSRPWNYALSATAGACIVYKGWRSQDYPLLAAAFFGVLPDIINKLGFSSGFSKIHGLFYARKQAPAYYLLIELAVVLLLLLAL